MYPTHSGSGTYLSLRSFYPLKLTEYGGGEVGRFVKYIYIVDEFLRL